MTTVLPADQSVEVQAAVNHRLTQRLRARARVDYFSDLLTQQLYHQNIYQSTRSTRVIDGSVSGTFGRASASAQYQRSEYLSSNLRSSVYGSTPRLAASIAPQMLFGTPIYASANTEYAFIPNLQLVNGNVATDRVARQVGPGAVAARAAVAAHLSLGQHQRAVPVHLLFPQPRRGRRPDAGRAAAPVPHGPHRGDRAGADEDLGHAGEHA